MGKRNGWHRRFDGQLAELRLDVEGARSGRLHLGVTIVVLVVAVTASGWLAEEVVNHTLFVVLGVIPSIGVGFGLIVGELIQVRADRRGEREADEREILAIRSAIAEVIRGEVVEIERAPTRTRRVTASAVTRSGRLVGGGRRRLLSRSGMLGLR